MHIMVHQTGWRRVSIQPFIILLVKQRVTERKESKTVKEVQEEIARCVKKGAQDKMHAQRNTFDD